MQVREEYRERAPAQAWGELPVLNGPIPDEAIEVLRLIRRGPRL